ncbi:DUF255 domain-containing protein [Schleiferia thermophila]|jgi:uncharacterized protein YyaL (SSP411 family)|nr:DUF255 domain-containing protein [Schleiferia thermophila]KFD38542.1 hypothetical protein AT05_09685 [Schleiferia thermophila str. Yellowstone]PMB17364.1 thioredoxin domain-containing protein [Fischerella thermalis CCMEE 5319]GCD79842.1 hypothetical protein JCM30197_10890 [Schleiferia thermophila]
MRITALMILVIAFSISSKGQQIEKIKWEPFNVATLNKAKEKNKYILLHLAANWCHWCHVMEEKTYQHPEVINYLNKHFIVCYEDHDKRPDLANRYREYGWPATIIFNSDAQEVFKEAGYIEAYEFLSILKDIKENGGTNHYASKKNILKSSGNNLSKIKEDLYLLIDTVNGGFKSPQKSLDFEMFEYAINHQNETIFKKWLTVTLPNSLNLLDTVWGGIFQYSTHNDWIHQHYEKLLSVQARYIKMYLWYYYITDDKKYLDAAIKIKDYNERFLKHQDSWGYSNAQDADLVKGVKSTNFFKFSDKERISLGIPEIDSTITTEGNAKLAESYCYLYAYTGDNTYLEKSANIINMLMNNYVKNRGLYQHVLNYDHPEALADQLSMLKALITLFKFTNDTLYLNETDRLISAIIKHLWENDYFLSFRATKGYIEPLPVISENIEAGRLINFYAKISKKKDLEVFPEKILTWLCTDDVYNEMVIEPGIISLSEEIKSEPFTGLYVISSSEDNEIRRELLSIPKFYYFPLIIQKNYLDEDKKELTKSFEDDVILFCTSNFCSQPFFEKEELKINIFRLLSLKN